MQRKSELKVYRDGRINLSGELYTKMRRTLCDLAGQRCEILKADGEKCGRYTPFAVGQCHHGKHRGMGGAWRDDRIFVNGEQINFWACAECHNGQHIPEKVVPQKLSEAELKALLGITL